LSETKKSRFVGNWKSQRREKYDRTPAVHSSTLAHRQMETVTMEMLGENKQVIKDSRSSATV